MIRGFPIRTKSERRIIGQKRMVKVGSMTLRPRLTKKMTRKKSRKGAILLAIS